MTLTAGEFMRRFLLHTVPDGFHRIRHIGFLANGHRATKLVLCRTLLVAPTPEPTPSETYRERHHRLNKPKACSARRDRLWRSAWRVSARSEFFVLTTRSH